MNKKMAAILGGAVVVVAAAAGAIAFQNKETPAETQAPSEAASIEPAAAEKAAEIGKPAEKAPSEDDPVVAKVNGANVLRSDVLALMQNMPPQMRQLPVEQIYPMVLDQVVAGKIVEEKAAKTDVAEDPEVSKRMVEAKQQIVRAVFMEKEIEKNLSEARVKKAYDKLVEEQGKVEEIKARHILVEKESEAKDIIAKLDGGAKFEELAKQFSKDSGNKATGGDLGYFTKDSMVKDFSDAVFKMKKGEITKTPVKTEFGYHVVEVEDRRNRPAPEFDTVKPMLEAQERREILSELLNSWREKADVELFDFNGKPIPASAKGEEPQADKAKEQ